MKSTEKAALGRILIDIIKADTIIDIREIELYTQLKAFFGLTRANEMEAYEMTVGQAVEILRGMDEEDRSKIVSTFNDMALSDGTCPLEEVLLMLMLKYCLDTDAECDVISRVIEDTWFDDTQVLFVESHYSAVNEGIKENYRTITRELKLCGMDFVYIPHVIEHYVQSKDDVLRAVIQLISPTLRDDSADAVLEKLKTFRTDNFCREQLHHKLGFEEMVNTAPALLLRINQSRVGRKIYTNFLRIELGNDVLKDVQQLVDTFMAYNANHNTVISNRVDEKGKFLYKGFHRQLLELLLLQKSVDCKMLIDLVKGRIGFPEVEVDLSSMHRKEKALYVLFVYECLSEAVRNADGTVSANGGINFTAPENARMLLKYKERMKVLQERYAIIYDAFGGNAKSAPDISKTEIRFPMLSGIRKAISKETDKIYLAETFTIQREHGGIYGLTAPAERFELRDFSNTVPVNFMESELVQRLNNVGSGN